MISRPPNHWFLVFSLTLTSGTRDTDGTATDTTATTITLIIMSTTTTTTTTGITTTPTIIRSKLQQTLKARWAWKKWFRQERMRVWLPCAYPLWMGLLRMQPWIRESVGRLPTGGNRIFDQIQKNARKKSFFANTKTQISGGSDCSGTAGKERGEGAPNNYLCKNICVLGLFRVVSHACVWSLLRG